MSYGELEAGSFTERTLLSNIGMPFHLSLAADSTSTSTLILQFSWYSCPQGFSISQAEMDLCLMLECSQDSELS